MPQPFVDPVLILQVADRLALARAEAFDASNELVDHYVDAGDAATQQALAALADHAADTLRALTDAFGGTVTALRAAAGSYADADRAVRRDLGGLGGRR